MPGLLIVSGTKHKTNSKSPATSEWTFNFRSGFESDSDSELSDEETIGGSSAEGRTATEAPKSDKDGTQTQTNNTPPESEDARLLRELDIASRAGADTVQFTTTPWTIARENAVLRAPPQEASLAPSSRSMDPGSNDKKLPGTVGFPGKARSCDLRAKENLVLDTSKDPALATAAVNAPPPKLGKNIEKFFAARKPKAGSSSKTFKPRSKAPHKSGTGSASALRYDQRVGSSPNMPTRSSHAFAHPTALRRDLEPDNIKLDSQSDQFVISYNNSRTVQPAWKGQISVHTSNKEPVSDASGSYDIETFESSSSTLYDDDFDAPMTYSPHLDLSDYALKPSYTHANESIYSQGPPLSAIESGFKGDHKENLMPTDTTYPMIKDDTDEDDLLKSHLSIPLPPVAYSNRKLPVQKLGVKRSVGSHPLSDPVQIGSGDFDNAPSTASGTVFPKQQFCHTGQTGYMRSFSPLKPALRNTGRSFLGLEAPRVMGGIYSEHPIPPNYSLGQWHPKKEEIDYHLPDPESHAAVQQLRRNSPNAHLSSPSLDRQRHSSPLQTPDFLRYQYIVKRPNREPIPQRIGNHSLYDDNNEDATWSTLPQRKKAKSQGFSSARSISNRKSSIKQSGRFKLPIALPSLAVKSVTSESAASGGKKRVIAYLPPPKDQLPSSSSRKKSREVSGARISAALKENVPVKRKGSETTSLENAKPISQWSVQRFNYGNDNITSKSKAAGNRMVLVSERPPTKAEDSDSGDVLPQFTKQESGKDSGRSLKVRAKDEISSSPGDETDTPASCNSSPHGKHLGSDTNINSDISVVFDVDSLERTYPIVRQVLLERKAAADGVWDELGLPSCGVPFPDDANSNTLEVKDEPGEVGRKREIAIVVWTGKPEQHFGVV